jgi:hypothetical protein
MSLKHPLTYPAPTQATFHTQIPKTVRDYYNLVFHNGFMRGPFKKISAHGAIPLAIGLAATALGHSQMFVRSVALIISAVWISLDIGVWLGETNWSQHRKIWLFCLFSWILCCSAMGIMYWFMLSTLEDQRTDVYEKLAMTHSSPSGHSNDPMFEMFSITNAGAFDISRNHGIRCLTNMAVGNHGTTHDIGVWSASHGNIVGLGFDTTPATSILESDGGTQTEACLRIWGNSFVQGGPDCVDVTVDFWYSLETQPDYNQEKKFRLIAFKGSLGDFTWAQEPVESQEDYCGKYFKPLGP